MNTKVSAEGTANEWDYGFQTMPYEPQTLTVTKSGKIFSEGESLWMMNSHYAKPKGYGYLHIASDRGMKITLKAYYTLMREIACEKNWNNFQLYAQTILEKRYGGFWRVYARI